MTHPSISTAPADAFFDADVLIVGAGPTGLTLATALLARGVRPLLVDRLAEGANTSRAAVIHARTLEVLEPLGIARELVARGLRARRFTIRDCDRVLLDIGFGALPTRYAYTLMISQAHTEAVLLQRFRALGGQVLRPKVLRNLVQDESGVTATFEDGGRARVRYAVGADGMHSTVREVAGIPFDGGTYGESFVLADVRLSGGVPSDEVILFFSPAGLAVVAPLPDGVHRVVATLEDAPERPTAADVQALLDARGPVKSPVQVHELLWGSRFRVHHRIARHYRQGRIVLAGDAAHVHSPAGGQGMNAGILDAVRLAQALGQALEGDAAALDAYGAERRPVAQEVIALADRLTRLATVPARRRPLRNAAMSLLSGFPWFRRRLAFQLSGLAYR